MCADCHVALVSVAPVADAGPRGPLEVLWEGNGLDLYTKLTGGLDEAGIRYYVGPQSDNTRRGSLFLLGGAAPILFSVVVSSSDSESARRILEDLLDQEPEDVSLPVDDSAEAGAGERSEEEVPEAWDEASATVEVWAGEDERTLEFLTNALRESGIPSRTEERDPQVTVFVRPEDEKRAREIVREVVEGAPPK